MAREFTAEDFGKWFPTQGGNFEFCPLAFGPKGSRDEFGVVGCRRRANTECMEIDVVSYTIRGEWWNDGAHLNIAWPPVVEEHTERRWITSQACLGFATFGLKPDHIETIPVDFALRYEDGKLVSVTAKVVEG